MGYTSHIGGFFALPYYWVIDDQSDATFTPMLTTQGGPKWTWNTAGGSTTAISR